MRYNELARDHWKSFNISSSESRKGIMIGSFGQRITHTISITKNMMQSTAIVTP